MSEAHTFDINSCLQVVVQLPKPDGPKMASQTGMTKGMSTAV
jgi:hypothetical protein